MDNNTSIANYNNKKPKMQNQTDSLFSLLSEPQLYVTDFHYNNEDELRNILKEVDNNIKFVVTTFFQIIVNTLKILIVNNNNIIII